jgi:hypothetical protein
LNFYFVLDLLLSSLSLGDYIVNFVYFFISKSRADGSPGSHQSRRCASNGGEADAWPPRSPSTAS